MGAKAKRMSKKTAKADAPKERVSAQIHLFVGPISDDSGPRGYVALTDCSPFMCIEKKTPEEAVQSAMNGWKFLLDQLGHKDASPRIRARKRFQANSKLECEKIGRLISNKVFQPIEVVNVVV